MTAKHSSNAARAVPRKRVLFTMSASNITHSQFWPFSADGRGAGRLGAVDRRQVLAYQTTHLYRNIRVSGGWYVQQYTDTVGASS